MEREAMAGATVAATDATFDAEVGHDGLVVVDFWAEWCGPCKMIAPILEQVATEYAGKGLRVAKVDVDANQATAMRYNIRSIPTLMFFKGGKPVHTMVGAMPKAQLLGKIAEYL